MERKQTPSNDSMQVLELAKHTLRFKLLPSSSAKYLFSHKIHLDGIFCGICRCLFLLNICETVEDVWYYPRPKTKCSSYICVELLFFFFFCIFILSLSQVLVSLTLTVWTLILTAVPSRGRSGRSKPCWRRFSRSSSPSTPLRWDRLTVLPLSRGIKTGFRLWSVFVFFCFVCLFI